MSVMIIVTGISASGKSTLANKIKNTFNIPLLSLDDYKVALYEKYGFKNDIERKILRKMAILNMKADIFLLMRENKKFIIEYPFDSTWQEFFDYLVDEYNYKSVIINCNSRSFDDIWNSRIKRESDFEERPKCLTAQAYIKDKLYISNNKLNDDYKEIKRKEYEEGKYTSLKGNIILDDKNYYDELKNKIK